MGYHRAGFDVVGVDIQPQPRFPFLMFARDDAREVLDRLNRGRFLTVEDRRLTLADFEAIHASPPCQHYAGSTAWRGNRANHPDLIAPVRELLLATELPYVIENVPDARRLLRNPVVICGDDVGLPIVRRRFFETNWPLHVFELARRHERRVPFDHGGTFTESEFRDAMGCEWMTAVEARQAIPPAYTELIGRQLLQHLKARVAA